MAKGLTPKMRVAAFVSNVASGLLFGGACLFRAALRLPLWSLRPRDLMRPAGSHPWHELALGYGIAVPVSGFFIIAPLTMLLAWLCLWRRRYLAALVTAWLPLLCLLLPLVALVLTLVLMNR